MGNKPYLGWYKYDLQDFWRHCSYSIREVQSELHCSLTSGGGNGRAVFSPPKYLSKHFSNKGAANLQFWFKLGC